VCNHRTYFETLEQIRMDNVDILEDNDGSND
jgi:hypothetical protein